MRYARHKDASHKAVVAAFKAHGCDVLVIDCSAADAWDLEVGFLGMDHGVEVKPTLKQALGRVAPTMPRPSQAAFFAKWRGAPVQVARTPEDVAGLVKLWRAEHEIRVKAANALVAEALEKSKPLVRDALKLGKASAGGAA